MVVLFCEGGEREKVKGERGKRTGLLKEEKKKKKKKSKRLKLT